MSMQDWEIVIGCEVHCQLDTQTKIFSGAPTTFGMEANTQVASVDLGLPGVLPVLNEKVIGFAIKAGLALECTINQVNEFARKNYFYPDLPKGYQISQAELPICEHGKLDFFLNGQSKRVGITRIHMEEDAGKSSHLSGKPISLVDLNRAGTPLVEIVSEPDMGSADEVVAYLKELRAIVLYLGICDGNMEEGSFRCDANVSVRKRGAELGTRCELKNINSFKFIKDAINYEAFRQVELIEAGGLVRQETRLYNPDRGITFTMRTKEEAHDYRYFPDPDLPSIVISDEELEAIRKELPELPAEKRERYQSSFSLSVYDSEVLAADKHVAQYFETSIDAFSKTPKITANWIINEVLRETKASDVGHFTITPTRLAGLIALLDDKTINGKIAKTVFEKMLTTAASAEEIVSAEGLRQVSDSGAIESVVDRLIEENPDKVEQYRAKPKMLGWFVGQVMKAMKGKANPAIVNDILVKKLNEEPK